MNILKTKELVDSRIQSASYDRTLALELMAIKELLESNPELFKSEYPMMVVEEK